MVYLTDAGRTELVASVRNYLENVPNVHAVKDEYYSPNNTYLTNFLSRTFCSSARPPHDGQWYHLNIQDLSNGQGGLGADVAQVEDFSLTPQHVASIQQTLQRKRGVTVVCFTVTPQLQGAHACLLVFDARTRKQHFFNPWGYRHHWMSTAFPARDFPLVEGFDPASRNDDAWVDQNDSIQAQLDNNHYDEADNCALYCILVGVLCTRFGVGKPKVMADIITQAVQEIDAYNNFNVDADNPAHSHMSRLWNWMNDMSNVAKATSRLPVLHANSTVTPEMAATRTARILEAQKVLHDFPPLQVSAHNSLQKVARRDRLRQRQTQYLNSHPELHQGDLVTAAEVAEREEVLRNAEITLIRLMFPPSMWCDVLLRSGNLCSRRACAGQPLCWQHRFLTRNHRLTGAGRMRCAAVQQPC